MPDSKLNVIQPKQFHHSGQRQPIPPVDGGKGGGHDGGMDDAWRGKVDERLGRLEQDVHGIKSAMDWAKIVVAILGTVVVGGFAIIITLTSFTLGRIDKLEGRLSEEFRAQRAEMSAQTSAIANAITATRQQAPPVVVLPAPPPAEALKH